MISDPYDFHDPHNSAEREKDDRGPLGWCKRRTIEAARDQAHAAKGSLRQAATAAGLDPTPPQAAKRAIREHPVGAIAAAAASGVGLMVLRRPVFKLAKVSLPLAKTAGRMALTYAVARQREQMRRRRRQPYRR